MFRLALPTAFATLLTLPAMAQQADPAPALVPPTPEAQTSPDTVPMPVLPAGGAGCDRTKQMTS